MTSSRSNRLFCTLACCFTFLNPGFTGSATNISEITPTPTPASLADNKGKIAYLVGDYYPGQIPQTLAVVDANGNNLRTYPVCGGVGYWSPDGNYVAYFTNTVKSSNACSNGSVTPLYLNVLSTKDGTVKVFDNTYNLFPSPLFWSSDSQHLAYIDGTNTGEQLFTINRDGSGLRQLTNDSSNKQSFEAAWSPDGQHLAFIAYTDYGEAIYTVKSDGTDHRRLTDDTMSEIDSLTPLLWLDNTQIIFDAYLASDQKHGNWSIYSVDDKKVVHRISTNTGDDTASNPSLSPDHKHIAYILSPLEKANTLCIIDADGRNDHCFAQNMQNLYFDVQDSKCLYYAAWSPDGQQLAFAAWDYKKIQPSDVNPLQIPYRIYTMNVDGSNIHRVTNSEVLEDCPVWIP